MNDMETDAQSLSQYEKRENILKYKRAEANPRVGAADWPYLVTYMYEVHILDRWASLYLV